MSSKYRMRGYKPNQLVHITCRGHQRKPIFLDERDQREFESRLRRLINGCSPRARPKLVGRARMTNHQHIFAQTGREGDELSRIMPRLLIGYAQYFNDRHGRSGRVFESPFRGRVVQGGADIVNVITYLHLNPDATLRNANSTHPVYTGELADPFIDTTIPLRAFGGREAYIEFFNDNERLRAARRRAAARL